MKKIILGILFLFMMSGVVLASTATVTVHEVKGHYVILEIDYTSDGTDAANVSLTANMDEVGKTFVERGMTMMVLNCDPDTGGTAPNTAFDVTFTDSTGIAILTTTSNAIAYDADTIGVSMSGDLGQYPVMTNPMYLKTEDLGDNLDGVTFYILCWVEDTRLD